jgi:cell division protein FtsL
MTPSALTPAARGSTKKSRPDAPSRPSSPRGSGHRSSVRRSVTPTAPRRVSGPTRGVAAAAAATSSGGVIAVPAPTRTRPSRPARPARARRTRRAAVKAPWGLRTSAFIRSLPDHALLDRIIRGRVWIPLLGVLLVGIVAMQVEVLKLNAGIGRSLERSSSLQGQNELLRASVAQLSDEQRIERIAAQMGMVMPAPTQLRFVHSGASSVERALASIHAPDGTSFIAQLPTIGAPAAPQGTAVNTSPGLAPTTPATTSATATGASGSPDASAASSTSGSSSTSGTSSTSSTTGTGTATGDTGTSTSTPTSTDSGTPAASTGSTSGTSAVTPAAPTTAGATDQSGSTSSGGASPVGG